MPATSRSCRPQRRSQLASAKSEHRLWLGITSRGALTGAPHVPRTHGAHRGGCRPIPHRERQAWLIRAQDPGEAAWGPAPGAAPTLLRTAFALAATSLSTQALPDQAKRSSLDWMLGRLDRRSTRSWRARTSGSRYGWCETAARDPRRPGHRSAHGARRRRAGGRRTALPRRRRVRAVLRMVSGPRPASHGARGRVWGPGVLARSGAGDGRDPLWRASCGTRAAGALMGVRVRRCAGRAVAP